MQQTQRDIGGILSFDKHENPDFHNANHGMLIRTVLCLKCVCNTLFVHFSVRSLL